MADGVIGETNVELAVRRAQVLGALASGARCSREEARAAGDALGLSSRQVYKLIARLRSANGNAAVLVSKRTASRETRPRSSISESDFQRVIDEVATQVTGPKSILKVARQVAERCRALGFDVPSSSTIRRRLSARSDFLKIGENSASASLSAPPTLRGNLPQVEDDSLLELLYHTVGNPAGWKTFLDALSHAYGDGIGTLMMHDFKNNKAFAEAPTFIEEKNKTSYVEYYSRINPWIEAGSRRAVGEIMQSDSILRFSDLTKTEFYNDWCLPQKFGGAIGVMAEKDAHTLMSITVFLARRVIERGDDLAGRLQRLTPHLLRVAQLNRQFASFEARAVAAENAIDRLATAMLVLNMDGQVVYLNRQADRIMAAMDGLTIRGGKLETYKSSENQALRSLIGSAAASRSNIESHPGGVMAISRRSGLGRYEVLAAPISDTTIRTGFDGPLVAVFIREPESKLATPIEWLRQIYGLTAAEGRLMQGLLAGENLEEIAARFAVTRETIRSQLRAIFQKTGATGQSDLIRMGMRSLTVMYRS